MLIVLLNEEDRTKGQDHKPGATAATVTQRDRETWTAGIRELLNPGKTLSENSKSWTLNYTFEGLPQFISYKSWLTFSGSCVSRTVLQVRDYSSQLIQVKAVLTLQTKWHQTDNFSLYSFTCAFDASSFPLSLSLLLEYPVASVSNACRPPSVAFWCLSSHT